MKASIIAKDLRTPKYRTRIVVSKKVYSRKKNKKNSLHTIEETS